MLWDAPLELPADLPPFDKVMLLGEPSLFRAKYPFLCLSPGDSGEKALFAQSRFPSEVLSGQVFVGSIFNALNRRQLECLGIECVVDLTLYDSPVERHKFPSNDYLNLPIAKDDPTALLDLDSFCLQAFQWLNRPAKLLIVCLDGDSFAPGLAIALLKFLKKEQSMHLISMSVFQKRGTVKVDKAFYGKVLEYSPNYALMQ